MGSGEYLSREQFEMVSGAVPEEANPVARSLPSRDDEWMAIVKARGSLYFAGVTQLFLSEQDR